MAQSQTESGAFLYHVSPMFNHEGIMEKGVDPHMSTGKLKVSWWVTKEKINWALAHTSVRWGVSVDRLVIYAFPFVKGEVARWSTEGIYTCGKVVRVKDYQTAEMWLSDVD